MTNREAWVMRFLAEGRTLAEIARIYNVRRDIIRECADEALRKVGATVKD